MTYHVYTYWRGTTPLYTGFTNNLRRRMREHDRGPWLRDATHVSVLAFETEREARMAESHCIAKLRPAQNVQGHPAFVVVKAAADIWQDDNASAYWRKRASLRVLRAAS